MIPVYCHECHGSGKKIQLEPNTDMAQFVFCKTCDGTGVRYKLEIMLKKEPPDGQMQVP